MKLNEKRDQESSHVQCTSKMFWLLLVLPISGGLALRGDEECECSGERWGRKSAIAFRSTDFRWNSCFLQKNRARERKRSQFAQNQKQQHKQYPISEWWMASSSTHSTCTHEPERWRRYPSAHSWRGWYELHTTPVQLSFSITFRVIVA